MKGRIFKSSYHVDGNDLVFDLYGRDEEREKFHLEVYGTEPYFLVEHNPSHLRNAPGVKRIEKSGRTTKGNELWKIVVDIPGDVTRLRRNVEPHYEADIVYKNRVRFDNNWKQYIEYPEDKAIYSESDIQSIDYNGTIEPRICINDIEVSDERGEKALDSENATEPIRSISLYDSYLDKYCVILVGEYEGDGWKEYLDEKLEEADMDITYNAKVVTVPTEKHLFVKLEEWFRKSKMDILAGWNYVDYDFKYKYKRAERIRKKFQDWLDMPATFDLMKGNSKLTVNTTRNKLEVQAKRILGVGKLKTPPIHKMYEDNKDLLVAYNLLDTILAKEISEYKGIMNHFPKLSAKCGIDITNLIRQSDIAEGYIFHKLQELADSEDEKVRLLSKEFVETIEQEVEGGYVGKAQKGLFNVVGVADFKSEYPMIILEFNISPETYTPEHKVEDESKYYISPNGNYYQKEPEGLIPRIMRELLEDREEVKKRMREAKADDRMDEYQRLYNEQRAIKVLMNSFYGLISSPGSVFRLSNKKCGDDITAFAREHVKFTAKKLEGENAS